MSLEFLHILDTWFWILLVCTIVILIWSFYSIRDVPRTRLLIVIRVTILFLLLICLLQPRISRFILNKQVLKWNIYIDDSISMGYHQVHSIESLNAGVSDLLKNITLRNVPFEQFYFSGGVTPVRAKAGLTADGVSTDLGVVLTHIKDESRGNLMAAVILTDGQATQGRDPVQISTDISVPIHIIGVGDTNPLVDVAVQTIDAPTVTVKGEDIDISVIISTTGTFDERLNVSLFKKKKMIGSRFVRIRGDGGQFKVIFRYKPTDIGSTVYNVQVSSLEDEINILNNRQNFSLMVLKDRYRVALVTGAPNFNTYVIKRIINTLPRLTIDHFVQYEQTFRPAIKSFWETTYDLIIFDNFPVQSLSAQWQRIFAKKLVAHKSSLAWIIGPNVSESVAEALFPFFRVNEVGNILDNNQSYPVTFTAKMKDIALLTGAGNLLSLVAPSELPPLVPGLQLEGNSDELWTLVKISSTIDVPVLLLGEKESLRSAVWTTPDLHHLYYMLTETQQSELVTDLWSSIITWLMRTSGDNDMFFRLDKDSYQQGEMISIMGNRIGKYSPFSQAAITIKRDSLTVNSTELQYNADKMRWEGQLWASAPGIYEYEVLFNNGLTTSQQTGKFIIEESQIELNNVFLNEGLLQNISANTGGQYSRWSSRAEIAELIQPRAVTESMIIRVKPTELWWLLAVLLLLLTIEWSWRRRVGLA